MSPRPDPKSIVMIASDFDGTLLGNDREVSERTRTALSRLTELQVEFVVATGRPPRYCDSIPKQTGIPTTLLCANGAVLHNAATGETRQFATLDLEDAQDLVSEIREIYPDASFCAEMGTDFVAETRWLELASREADGGVANLAPLLDDRVHKLLVNLPDKQPDEILDLISPLLQGRANALHAGLPFIELMPPGVDKAFGLAHLCEERQITPDQIIAFGDMPNDDAMLKFVCWGVAVANAHTSTKAVADEVADSNLEDGVAKFLEDFLRIR